MKELKNNAKGLIDRLCLNNKILSKIKSMDDMLNKISILSQILFNAFIHPLGFTGSVGIAFILAIVFTLIDYDKNITESSIEAGKFLIDFSNIFGFTIKDIPYKKIFIHL